MGISFVTYDYKFNHLVIVSYFTVSFMCDRNFEISNKEVWNNVWNFYRGFLYTLILCLHITKAIVYQNRLATVDGGGVIYVFPLTCLLILSMAF